MKKQLITPLLGAGAFAAMLFAAAPQASAVSYGFYKLTNNGAPNIASQLSVDVTVSGTEVSFQFFNNVGIASSIAEIYFDDGFLGNPPTITDSDGGFANVKYVLGASPQNLPGGNFADPDFVATLVFNSEAANPVSRRGVSASDEWVKLTFGLGSFADLAGIQTALNRGDLRIGLHMVAIANDAGSDSYVNGPPVPDGGTTLLLLGSALTGLGVLRRKFGVKIG